MSKSPPSAASVNATLVGLIAAERDHVQRTLNCLQTDLGDVIGRDPARVRRSQIASLENSVKDMLLSMDRIDAWERALP